MNESDSQETIRHFLSRQEATFKIGLGKGLKLSDMFGLRGWPSNYLLDSEAKVVYRSVGYDEPALLSALETLGIK